MVLGGRRRFIPGLVNGGVVVGTGGGIIVGGGRRVIRNHGGVILGNGGIVHRGNRRVFVWFTIFASLGPIPFL